MSTFHKEAHDCHIKSVYQNTHGKMRRRGHYSLYGKETVTLQTTLIDALIIPKKSPPPLQEQVMAGTGENAEIFFSELSQAIRPGKTFVKLLSQSTCQTYKPLIQQPYSLSRGDA